MLSIANFLNSHTCINGILQGNAFSLATKGSNLLVSDLEGMYGEYQTSGTAVGSVKAGRFTSIYKAMTSSVTQGTKGVFR